MTALLDLFTLITVTGLYAIFLPLMIILVLLFAFMPLYGQ